MGKSGKGQGTIVSWGITDDGQVWLRAMGKDSTAGHWAVFTIKMRHRDWCSLERQLDRLREEIAQQEIPYE